MKVALVNTYDITGGAARAAYRLHRGLRQAGCDSWMYVQHKKSNDPHVVACSLASDTRSRIRHAVQTRRITYTRDFWLAQGPQLRYEMFSHERSIYQDELPHQLRTCDVLHLHWVTGLVDWPTFFARVPSHIPLLWTLHDMNAFTGGCHYDNHCGRYRIGCGSCPQLSSTRDQDLSRTIWQSKWQGYQAFPRGQLHVVTPSRWLAHAAQHSTLLAGVPVSVIPYGLDISVFAPRDRAFARKCLGVPQDAWVVLFVAQSHANQRKGFDLLLQALAGLDETEQLLLLALGETSAQVNTPTPCTYLGSVEHEGLLSLVYSAADLYVIPSLQDNLPNTVLEAMACGTPVVGFDVGGIPDMVRPGVTGLLVPPYDVAALQAALLTLRDNPAQRAAMSAACRRIAVEEYALDVQAQRYIQLYQTCLERSRTACD